MSNKTRRIYRLGHSTSEIFTTFLFSFFCKKKSKEIASTHPLPGRRLPSRGARRGGRGRRKKHQTSSSSFTAFTTGRGRGEDGTIRKFCNSLWWEAHCALALGLFLGMVSHPTDDAIRLALSLISKESDYVCAKAGCTNVHPPPTRPYRGDMCDGEPSFRLETIPAESLFPISLLLALLLCLSSLFLSSLAATFNHTRQPLAREGERGREGEKRITNPSPFCQRRRGAQRNRRRRPVVSFSCKIRSFFSLFFVSLSLCPSFAQCNRFRSILPRIDARESEGRFTRKRERKKWLLLFFFR